MATFSETNKNTFFEYLTQLYTDSTHSIIVQSLDLLLDYRWRILLFCQILFILDIVVNRWFKYYSENRKRTLRLKKRKIHEV